MTPIKQALNPEDVNDKQLLIILKAFQELNDPLLLLTENDCQPLSIQREQMRRGMLEKIGMARTNEKEIESWRLTLNYILD